MDTKQKQREKLKAKLQKKKEARTGGGPSTDFAFDGEQPDIVKMMENVNNILKTNPQMVQHVSKCVSNVMNNKTLLDSLVKQFQEADQTRDNNEPEEEQEASPKDVMQ